MLRIGTSGWQYRDWRPAKGADETGYLYPGGLPQRSWLAHYADRFGTVEINNAFYRLPERDTFAKWRDQTPDGFLFAVKMSRYLTHINGCGSRPSRWPGSWAGPRRSATSSGRCCCNCRRP